MRLPSRVRPEVREGILRAVSQETPDVGQHVLLGLIEQESSFDASAYRYEARYRWLHQPERHARFWHLPVEIEIKQQKTSWGLTQIMGAVMREKFPFSGIQYFEELYNPYLATLFGIRLLNQIHSKYDDLTTTLAVYNGGTGALVGDGGIKNIQYVIGVLEKAQKYL